jgi:hypothetical protein
LNHRNTKGIDAMSDMSEPSNFCRPCQAAPGCDVIGFAIEAEQLQELRQIIKRLYDATTLSYDARRDLAYRLSLMRDTAMATPVKEENRA